MNTLDSIALKYGTDKSSAYHGYAEQYEAMLDKFFRAFVKIVVEIGVCRKWDGNHHNFPSLAMWREWMPAARVIGADIRAFDKPDDGMIELVQADQGSLFALADLYKHITDDGTRMADLIIDDGSHYAAHQQQTLLMLWPALRHGGKYIIEDLNYRPCKTRRRSCTKQVIEAWMDGKHPEWIVNLRQVLRESVKIEFVSSKKAGEHNAVILTKGAAL